MSHLIDTTEMYLRTVLELQEERVVPLRARIAERLEHSGPTVSQTVARMERDGLLRLADDRHLELTAEGRALATRVMRKHRLTECLLFDMIDLEWEQIHAEACRWEHVMSEAVERRLLGLLRHPTHSPYGNPIPGLSELGAESAAEPFLDGTLVSLGDLRPERGGVRTTLRRIGESVQNDSGLMYTLRHAGIRPGAVVSVTASPDGVTVGSSRAAARIPASRAKYIFVTRPEP
ncbi:metal-dependent transcriptional regulator [Streptomyces sp. NPDC007083]|uniref:metal-dependent transcriptional regulator n=1 Tax=Streptomyces sp. NPDC007083 TaxID=3156913 RepID=UPI0033D6C01B